MAKRDYYEVLGVGRSASAEQVKTAYRRLARKFHPDVSKAADASQRFKEATEAYEVLSDPAKRAKYDEFGHAGPFAQGGPGPGRGYARQGGQGGGGVPFDFQEIFGGRGGGGFGGMSLDDIMEALGGGSRRRGRRGAQEPAPSGADIEHAVPLDFMQAIRGGTITLQIQQEGGGGETLNVKIPPGVHEGSRIRLRGKGQGAPGGSGDLYIVVHINEHPYFRREGNDIYVELPIGITEAALGATIEAPTIDGMTKMKIPAGSGSGRVLRLRGKGVQGTGPAGRGDQYVKIKIVPPPAVSARGQEFLRQFDQAEPFDPRAEAPWK